MEAAVSSSLGAMGPVLRKLDLLLAPESRLRKRVKDGIGLLKQDLEEVSSALVDLSMLETPSLRAKCWMEEARELSYHIEDFVDDLMLIRRDAGAKIRSVSSYRVGRVKIALLPAPPRRSTRVAKIAQLRDLLWQASERLERYQLDACCSSPNHMNMITQHRRAPALYGYAANLVGIEDSRIKLIEMLTGEAEQQLKVASIVGPAGVGKTTLAKVIFRELRGQFELRAFVHASRKIDMKRLLGSILSQVQPHHQLPSVADTVQSLIDSIQEQLRDQRYFIVIDDLWEETAWDIVRGAFPEGNNCSRIVATTENMNVALKCCGYMADNILKMKPLGIQDSGYLFFNRVFGSEQQCPDELKEVSYGIIRKCCGLPLSLIHVAGLLASIDYSEPWYHVHDHLCSILNRSHTVEEIQKKILNLSYNSLPPSLKTCLLYFNMYPEGYIMWKVHLVKQWIAEGFINAAEGKDREEIAEGYFEKLVTRGMVQPMKIDYNDEVLSCTVHNVIFDLINHNSKEEEFIAAVDYSQPITGLSTKAHRLSFRFSSAKYAKQLARITMSQLRSLGFFGFLKCMPPIMEFKHLRVLVLDFWGSHEGHMSLDLSSICILFQLRHLMITGDIMVELPTQMQRLRYLETLEIDARLAAVPLDIIHLPSLLHLGLRAATKLPDGIGHIKSLSTLLYFDLSCNSEDNIWSLSKLTNLQHLHLTCSSALSSDHLKRKLIPLVFSLGKFGNLKSLSLIPKASRTAIFFDIWSGVSSPPMFLQKLELLPPICFFYRLPSWIGELHKLCILKIMVKELQGNDISNISGLPSLVVFSLYVRTAFTGTVVFSTMAFSALKYFKFTCGVMCLAFHAGAMPNLQRLKLCFNAHRGKNHSRMLDGIEHLLNLQEVAGRIGVLPGADESDWRVVKLLFEDTIRKHPSCPRFNSKLVDFIEEEYPPLDKFQLVQHEGSSSEHENIEKVCAEDMDKHIDSRLEHIEDNLKHLSLATPQPDLLELHKLQTVEKHLERCLDVQKAGDWKSVIRESDAAIATGAYSSPLMDVEANHWPALSDAAPSAVANSSSSQKHDAHHGRQKSARRGGSGGGGGEHSPRDHPDRSTATGWDHAGGGSGRGAQRNHNNRGGRRGNGAAASATGPSHHGSGAGAGSGSGSGRGGGGGFGGRRRGANKPPFYRGPPPPMGMGHYMRGAPPPPPSPVLPMRPFAGPMVFHDMPSPVSPVSPIYFYGPPPPEALRGPALAPPMVGPPAYPYFQAQPEPQPDADEERVKLLKQIEFYFSKENLCSDVYLRQQMDGQGWVDISLIAGFKRVQGLKKDLQYIKETVQSSSILEMKDDKIRKHNDWEKWVIPRENNPDAPVKLSVCTKTTVLYQHRAGRASGRGSNSQKAIHSGNEEAPIAEESSGQQ